METALPANQDQPWPPGEQTGMPRRFGVGTLLGLTTFYAMLFAMLSSCEAPPGAFAAAAVFLTGIVAAQMFLFGGRKPREASILVGGGMAVLLAMTGVVEQVARGSQDATPWPLLLIVAPPIGALAGYALGGAFGGTLLLVSLWRERSRARQAQGDADTPDGTDPKD